MEINKSYPCRETNFKKGRAGAIRYIVIHYVGALGSAKENAVYYGRDKVEASAHYFVDHGPGAAVYASVAEGDTAWHCGAKTYQHPECRNANSIGIEMCCWKDPAGKWYFDPETVDRAVELTRELMAKYGIDADHVVRHYDVTGKCCPAPFVLDPAAWKEFKGRLTAQEGEIDMTKEEIRAMVEKAVESALADRDMVQAQAAQKVSPWAAEAWDKAVAVGVFDGTRPGGVLTREQAATTYDRMGMLD